jgi:hypothetical protein
MKLLSFTSLAFSVNSVLDQNPATTLSFAEVRDSAKRGVLVQDLARRFGEQPDLSLLLSDEHELSDLNLALTNASNALEGRVMRRVGVSKNGLCLVMALILEAIEQQFSFWGTTRE